MAGDATDLLSAKDVARMVGVHIKTVRKWDRDGLLPPPCFFLGGVRRWHRDTIAVWIRSQRGMPAPATQQGKEGVRGSKREQKGTSTPELPNTG